MALKVGDLLAVLKADTSDFDKKMRGATQALVSPRGLLGAFGAVSAAVAAFAAAATAGAVALARFTNRGGQVLNVQRAFTRATGESEKAIRDLRDATQGLISDYDLMQGFNRALALGAANNAQEFGELSRTALTLGRALGVDATFAMESLSLGIGRQSRLILDNLGLIVSVEKANKDYAAALGKTVAQLTEAEKKEAFRTAAMEAARSKIEQLGGIQETNADNVTRLRIAYENFRDELATLVAQSPAVREFFNTLIGLSNDLMAVLRETLDPERIGADFQRAMRQIQTAGTVQKATRLTQHWADELVRVERRMGEIAEDFAHLGRKTPEQLAQASGEYARLLQRQENYNTLIAEGLLRISNLERGVGGVSTATGESAEGLREVNREGFLAVGWAGQLVAHGMAFRAVFGEDAVKDVSNLREELEALKDTAKEAMEGAKDEMKGTLEKGVEQATKNFDRLGEQAGRKLIDGIIQGSLDMEGLLKSILSTLISRALFGGILAFSPSRLGIEAGERLQQGIIRGMENTNRMLAASVTTGVGSALDRATPSANTGQGPLMVNMPDLPEPVTPEAQAVNRYWLETWKATARAAKARGFRG